jgi:hypothetical protein
MQTFHKVSTSNSTTSNTPVQRQHTYIPCTLRPLCIMVNVTFTTTLITISLYMLIIPRASSKDIQVGWPVVVLYRTLMRYIPSARSLSAWSRMESCVLVCLQQVGEQYGQQEESFCAKITFPGQLWKIFSNNHHHNCVKCIKMIWTDTHCDWGCQA